MSDDDTENSNNCGTYKSGSRDKLSPVEKIDGACYEESYKEVCINKIADPSLLLSICTVCIPMRKHKLLTISVAVMLTLCKEILTNASAETIPHFVVALKLIGRRQRPRKVHARHE